MLRALRFSLVLLALLLVSLTPKFLLGSAVVQPDEAALGLAIADRLRARGFVNVAPASVERPYVRAKRGACQIIAMNMDPEGHMVTWFVGKAAKVGPARFYYKTGQSLDFPRFWPPIEQLVQKASFRIGLNIPRAPVIAIAASPACQNMQIDWSGLELRGTRRVSAWSRLRSS